MKRLTSAIVLTSSIIAGCAASGPTSRPDEAPVAVADLAASQAAERVMETLGGADAWESTRYISWTFFGRRSHVWDKHSGDIRVSETDDDGAYVVVMNLDTRAGRVVDREVNRNADLAIFVLERSAP